eukprot:Gb_23013 [translate_table: standard]
MQADPACVDLRSRCPYFYELACKIAPLLNCIFPKNDSAPIVSEFQVCCPLEKQAAFLKVLISLVSDRSLGSFILYTLRGRYKDILCKAHSVAFSVTSKFLQHLTREESQWLALWYGRVLGSTSMTVPNMGHIGTYVLGMVLVLNTLPHHLGSLDKLLASSRICDPLFEAARDSMRAFKKWRLQGSRLEKASVLGLALEADVRVMRMMLLNKKSLKLYLIVDMVGRRHTTTDNNQFGKKYERLLSRLIWVVVSFQHAA